MPAHKNLQKKLKSPQQNKTRPINKQTNKQTHPPKIKGNWDLNYFHPLQL